MSLADAIKPETPPLRLTESGQYRVGQTRIPLERVVYCFNIGESAEDIVRSFDTLNLADVYAVIAFYLRNRDAVDANVQEQELRADAIEHEMRERFPSAEIKKKMLARYNQMKAAGTLPTGMRNIKLFGADDPL